MTSPEEEVTARYEAGQNSNEVPACLAETPKNGDYITWRCSLNQYHNGDHAAHHLHNVDEPARITWVNEQYVISELEIP